MGTLNANRPPPGVRERRRFGRRLAITHPLEVAGKSGGFAARTVNVSRTGVLLWITDERFLPLSESENMVLFTERVADEFGEGLEVRLSQDIAIEAEVVRVTRRGERDTGAVLIACRYARPLTKEEWQRLEFEHLPSEGVEQEITDALGAEHAGHDRRRASRLMREQPVEIHSDYAAYRAQVLDVSAVGVLLKMTDPAFTSPSGSDRLMVCTRRLGTQFSRGMRVRFLEADVTVQAEIVRVGERKSAEGADILVGCKFDAPLDPRTCGQLGIEPMRIPSDDPSAPRAAAAKQTRVRDLMRLAREQGASDLHLKAGSPPRARVGGALSNLESGALGEEEIHAMALDLLDPPRADRLAARGHAEAVVSLDRVGRFRVSAFRQQGRTALAVRCLPADLPALPPEQRALAAIPDGLVLLAGRAGSGRSSTLAALIEEINRTRACHVLTLEDPVEYSFRELAAHITQRDLAADAVTAREALRQTRHLDVDVVALDRVAHAGDALALLEAAEAGRLVLGVLDAGSPEEAIERFVQVVAPEHRGSICARLGAVLRAAGFQRLVHDEAGATRLESTVRRITPADARSLRDGTLPGSSLPGTPRS